METLFNISLKDNYTSQAQVARVLTEDWVRCHSFCPNCGNSTLSSFTNNQPVADFYCRSCNQEYELKSKKGKLGAKIVDGSYTTMIERINANNNPNFFFLTYNQVTWSVQNFLVIPRHYFVPEIIQKRTPLSMEARRAGWTGCNIILSGIPASGRIFLIKDSLVIDKEVVTQQWQNTAFLKEVSQNRKGWILEIMKIVDEVKSSIFKLEDIYKFIPRLQIMFPQNNHIKDKVRQQLQFLRDLGYLEFIGRGLYKKAR